VTHYVVDIIYGVLSLHGSLAATSAGVLGEAAAPVVVLTWLQMAGRPRPDWLGKAGRRAGDIGVGIAVGLGMFVASEICVGITLAIARAIQGHNPTFPNVGRDFHGGWLVAYGFLLIVAAPICEEVLFRGFLFRGLRTRWGWWPSAFLSSGLFALVHASPYRLLNTFVDGLILARIYEGRKDLLTTIASHCTLNTIVFLIVLGRLH